MFPMKRTFGIRADRIQDRGIGAQESLQKPRCRDKNSKLVDSKMHLRLEVQVFRAISHQQDNGAHNQENQPKGRCGNTHITTAPKIPGAGEAAEPEALSASSGRVIRKEEVYNPEGMVQIRSRSAIVEEVSNLCDHPRQHCEPNGRQDRKSTR